MVELADIVRRHGPSYLKRRGRRTPDRHRRALEDIAACHTPAMGGRLLSCPRCCESKFVGFSCRNRACPRCHGKDAARWLKTRGKEILPVPYYHIVFTLPQELHGLLRANPGRLLSLFMRCVAKTILQLAAQSRWLGGRPALLTVLHTARRDLGYHPHVHCLVSAGGYDSESGQWIDPPKNGYLFPGRVLGRVFREIFLNAIRAEKPGVGLPRGLYKRDWVVHCEGSQNDPSHVVAYLARYVFRLPLSNGRLIEAGEDRVVYKYQPNNGPSPRLLKLDPHVFLDRYLQHVLPKGFHAVRYWGLWAAVNRTLLSRVQQTLASRPGFAPPSAPRDPPTPAMENGEPAPTCPSTSALCPRCQTPFEHQGVARKPRASFLNARPYEPVASAELHNKASP